MAIEKNTKKYYAEASSEYSFDIERAIEDVHIAIPSSYELETDGENWQGETQAYFLRCFENINELLDHLAYCFSTEDDDVIHNIYYDKRFSEDTKKLILSKYPDAKEFKWLPKSCAKCDHFNGEYGFCDIMNRGGKMSWETDRFEDCPLEK